MIHGIQKLSRKHLFGQTLVPLSSPHTAVEDSFVSLNAVLIPENLYSIIHAKYITFQLTNCQALEISLCPRQVSSSHGGPVSSPVFLIHSDLKRKEFSKYLREQNEL